MILKARNPFQITGNTPVDSWYSEVKKHDFTGEPRTTGTGHFTQVNYLEGMVWTKETCGKHRRDIRLEIYIQLKLI